MKNLYLLLFYVFSIAAAIHAEVSAEKRYVGGDISLLPEYESAGAQYKDHEGKPVADVLTFCRDEGMNAMRVRLFVNPSDYDGEDKDPNACQTLDYIIPLCKRIKALGLDLVLDFMYSDTWADPEKQWTPKAWAGMTDEGLCQAIYDYTKNSLLQLKDEGIIPDFIQTGNEISYGMLWGTKGSDESSLKKTLMGSDANWERFGDLLKNAGKACREVCPQAKIIIHTERIGDTVVQQNFYRRMESMDIDYDVIGVSYYPYWHGSLDKLDKGLTELETDFPEKKVMVVETGYPYKWEVPGTTEKVDFPYTDEGQNEYAKALVATLERHPGVNGLFWWWFEYNAYGTSLSNWYNAPLFDSTTGWATSALKTICSYGDSGNGVETIGSDMKTKSTRFYDLTGRRIHDIPKSHGIIISEDGKKILSPGR